MDGENTRVMELYTPPIDDTDFAREVHQISAENYGFAGQIFMDYLFREYELEKGISKLRKAYAECRDIFNSSYELGYGKCTSIYMENVPVSIRNMYPSWSLQIISLLWLYLAKKMV